MNRQSSEKIVDLRVLEVLHISCNTGTFALSDMSALAHAILDVMQTYQAMYTCTYVITIA